MTVPRCLFLWLFLSLAGCRQDMHDQPRFEPLEYSSFFPDGRSSRNLVPGTVARGRLQLDPHHYEGRVDGEWATEYPFPMTASTLERGRERYDIFCAVCHGFTGNGDGFVVQRGMKPPSSFHIPRLVESPVGYYFDVITNGFGVMYDYADRIPADDRWAIIAYVQALQLSQDSPLEVVPPAEQDRLQKGTP